jgi:hypothetical protein
LVLDLRNDPGGLLDAAVAISAAFLPQNVTVVSTNGQLAESKATYKAEPEFYARRGSGDPLKRLPAALKKVPLVVLVNEGSASASEIVAGALQDHKRATIMGSQTFGKGSVQTVRPLGPDTGIKLTTARYYTPSGKSIQAKGIVPDVMVDETAEGDVFAALRMREADLDKHLGSGQGEEQKDEAREKAREEARKRLEEEAKKPAARAQAARVWHRQRLPAAQALNQLKGRPCWSARRLTERKEEKKERTEPVASSTPQGRAPGSPAFLMRHAKQDPHSMTDDQLLRYSRHILLDEVGIEGQERIWPAHALVIGAGGLGSPAALYLGVGGRGAHHAGGRRCGRPHQPAAPDCPHHRPRGAAQGGLCRAGRARRSTPCAGHLPCRQRADAALLDELVPQATVVLDCSDNYATRHAVNAACVRHGKPLVAGAAIRFDGQITVVDPRDARIALLCLRVPARRRV